MEYRITPFVMEDYEAAMALWRASRGIVISGADEPGPLAAYLARNPGTNFAAKQAGCLVGTVLCGNDGRRGYLHHLAVAAAHQRKGLGTKLVRSCLDALREKGLQKCHLFLEASNTHGLAFWEKAGWFLRTDMNVMSRFIDQ